MNIDRLNPWLSFAANVGVIAGFIFLAVEIRQNNAIVSLEFSSNVAGQVNPVVDMIINDSELVALLHKDTADLDDVEADRLRLIGIRILMVFENSYRNIELGLISEEDALRTQRAIYHRPTLNYGVPFTWSTFKNRAGPEFAQWFEQKVISTSRDDP